MSKGRFLLPLAVVVAVIIALVAASTVSAYSGLTSQLFDNPDIMDWVRERWWWLVLIALCPWLIELGVMLRWRSLLSRHTYFPPLAEAWHEVRGNARKMVRTVLPIATVIAAIMLARLLATGSQEMAVVVVAISFVHLPALVFFCLFAFLAELDVKPTFRWFVRAVTHGLCAGGAWCISVIAWWAIIFPQPLAGRAWAVPAAAGVVGFFLHDTLLRKFAESFPSPIGPIVVGQRKGRPSILWTQVVGTGQTKAGAHWRAEGLYLGLALIFGAAVGFWNNALIGAGVGAGLALMIASLGLRGAPRPDGRGNWIPHTPTAAERREGVEPVTRREDCEAFLDIIDGQLHFCVARGNKRLGPLPVVECVPWDSFENFEEGTHKQWFRSRGAVDERLDWGVIIAQSNVGRIVRVAENVDDHAWLIEFLVLLQNTFIADRPKQLKEFRDATRDKSEVSHLTGTPEDYAQDVPVRPF